ncbi:MAG: hypothetical protein FJX03_01320 [Alphaproteobacteria bacterium]|nr:hypothetical protein [Alphaproteobacteria bacterium]
MILKQIQILFVIILLIFPSVVRAMECEEDSNTPRLTVKEIVLHNINGSLCDNGTEGKGKKFHVQLGFFLLKQTSGKSMASSNIITINPGEKKTIVIPVLPLWPCRDSQANQGLVFYNQIDSNEVFLKVIWSTGDLLNDSPLQSVLIRPFFSNNSMKQTNMRRSHHSEHLLSSCTWFRLKEATTIQIDVGTSQIGNENYPIVKFLQKDEDHKDGG